MQQCKECGDFVTAKEVYWDTATPLCGDCFHGGPSDRKVRVAMRAYRDEVDLLEDMVEFLAETLAQVTGEDTAVVWLDAARLYATAEREANR